MNMHQTLIRLTRNFSEAMPVGDMTFTDVKSVIEECELSWYNHGHCENPYPTKDPRFAVWSEHTLTIWERLKVLAAPLDGEFEIVLEELPAAPVAEILEGEYVVI